LLETLANEDILPKGTNIQTRCPIILQLVNSQKKWAEFLHLPGEEFTDMSKVREEFDRENEKIKNSGQVISDVPIRLTLHSPDVTNLTLVDTPGLCPVGNFLIKILNQILPQLCSQI